ncbi:uncharacterized protein LOC126377451 [Pectinophora gossypiella]|uniref:uncharacterized protein LOC126377451 n=1 Tax=Pectinophora gossypiella TaxID=13191 RepID=UPI00214EB429|nr:uncharacterized protein LOC126377451 [Pectinophora gossypiella]
MSKRLYVREEMNNEVLIKEVEIRAPLYDRSLAAYNDVHLKSLLWEEIAEKLFPHTWEKMNADQKEKAARDVQKRWKNLRACFTRELRHQKNIVTKRRKYVYYDKLLFLSPTIEQLELSSRTEDNEEDYRIEEEEYDIKEDTINIPINIPNYQRSNSRKRNHDGSSFMEFIQDRQSNPDSDTSFALSIVPMLKAVPFRDKIDAQMAILKVLKNFVQYEESSRGTTYNDSIKIERIEDDYDD